MKQSPLSAIQLLSKTLTVIGVIVFLFGDRFLRNILHFNFVTGEMIGILSGLLLCAVGIAIARSAGVKS